MEPKHEFGKEAMERERLRLEKNKKMKRTIKAILLLAVITTVIFLWSDIKDAVASTSKKEKTKTTKAEYGSAESPASGSPGVVVMKKWDLPKVLTEVSGIGYIDEGRFACVQDEQGTVYIYNTSTATIEKEIPFAGVGDYEGLALVNEAAWVVRSDGHLYEIDNINAAKPGIKEYSTHLTADHNIEGLCYDKKNNRLLLATKDAEPGNKDYKGIYAFDLASRTMAKEPVFKIDLLNPVFTTGGSKKNKDKTGAIMPSAIAIHPVTADMYITDGRKAKLLVMDASGTIKKLYQLNSKEFAQPEGITFNPAGKMFISNEGPKQPANILSVEVATE